MKRLTIEVEVTHHGCGIHTAPLESTPAADDECEDAEMRVAYAIAKAVDAIYRKILKISMDHNPEVQGVEVEGAHDDDPTVIAMKQRLRNPPHQE